MVKAGASYLGNFHFFFVVHVTDSTIAPPQTGDILTNVSWLVDTRKDAMKKPSSHNFMFAKVYRTMTSGWQGPPYFGRYGRELVSKPAISLKKSWVGYRRTTHVRFIVHIYRAGLVKIH